MQKNDTIRMRHMLDAARDARAFAHDHRRADLEDDRLLALGLLKCIEIVGEAASQVAPDRRTQHPEIPWQDIVGMRNRLIHAYYDVDLDLVWDTIETDLPPLITVLEKILGGSTSRDA